MEGQVDFNAVNTELKIYGEPAKLFQALNKARLEFGDVKKQALNPHFGKKYADLETTLGAVSIPLANNGIGLMQTFTVDEKEITLKSIVFHDSGTFLEATTKVPASQGTRFDIQTIGGAVTYARRYEAQALFMLAPEDDDGNGVVDAGKKQDKKIFSSSLQFKDAGGLINQGTNILTAIATGNVVVKSKQTDFPFPEKEVAPEPQIPDPETPVKELTVEPLPNPLELEGFRNRIRKVQVDNNVDGRTIKGFLLRKAKVKNSSEITKPQFESIISDMETLSGDKDGLTKLITKTEE